MRGEKGTSVKGTSKVAFTHLNWNQLLLSPKGSCDSISETFDRSTAGSPGSRRTGEEIDDDLPPFSRS